MSEDAKPAGSKSPSKRGRPRKSAQPNGSGPVAELEAVPNPPPNGGDNGGQETPPDAVVIVKTVGEDGTLNVDVQAMGNVQVTEIQTLIELGLNSFRNRIGLGPKAS